MSVQIEIEEKWIHDSPSVEEVLSFYNSLIELNPKYLFWETLSRQADEFALNDESMAKILNFLSNIVICLKPGLIWATGEELQPISQEDSSYLLNELEKGSKTFISPYDGEETSEWESVLLVYTINQTRT